MTEKVKVVNNITRISQSILKSTISVNPIELKCRLDILKEYIDKAKFNRKNPD